MEIPVSNPIVVVCGTNAAYAMPLGVALASMSANLAPGRSVHVYVLSGGLSETIKGRLSRAVSDSVALEHLTIDDSLLSGYPTIGCYGVEALLRLCIPRVLPESVKKVLYFDCDICVTRDIGELWDQDVSPFPLLAARDLGARTVSGECGLPNYAKLGLPADSPYFNSGVLLMNLDRWRDEQIGERALEYVQENKDVLIFPDQDALNALLSPTFGMLNVTWNMNVNQIRNIKGWPESEMKDTILTQAAGTPAICHYASRFKPWNPGYQIPFVGQWLYYLFRSGWFGYLGTVRWIALWSAEHTGILFRREFSKRKLSFRSAPSGH